MPANDSAFERTERHGPFVIAGAATYLADVQVWEAKVTISRLDGTAQDFVVPSGPECYRKSGEEALNAAWAAARQWLDGGRIPWKAKPAG